MNAVSPWQKKFSKLNDSLLYVLENEMFTDCSFAVGKGNNKKIVKAHKFVLAQVSMVFERMFYGLLAQTSEGIDESETDPDLFVKLLRFIYKDAIILDDVEQAIKMYVLADKYEIWKLMVPCIKFMMDNLKPSNVLRVYEFLNRYSLTEEMQVCKKLVVRNTNIIFQNSDFINISMTTLLMILREDNLNVKSELEIYKAAVNWINFEFARREIVDNNQKRAIYKEVMSQIRFMSMNIKDFADIPASDHYLELEESFAIFANLSSKSTPIKLPSHLSNASRFHGWKNHLPDNWAHQLIQAARAGNLSKMKSLAAEGANLKIRDTRGCNLLDFAAGHGYEDMTTWLINKGISVNWANSSNSTPLSTASLNGRLGTVMILLSAGADQNIPDQQGRTSRQIAARIPAVNDLFNSYSGAPVQNI